MKNKNLWIIGIVIVLIIVEIIYFNNQKKGGEEVVNIALIAPMTGSNSYFGQYISQGLEIGIEKINNEGGINDKKIKLVLGNSEGDSAKGVSEYQNLAKVRGLKIFFSSLSGVTLAIAPIAESDKSILFNIGSSSPKISSSGDYIFRHNLNPSDESNYLANKVYKDLGYKKIAIIVENSEGTIGIKDSFVNEYKKIGGEIISEDVFDYGNTDFRTILSKIKTKNPPAILIPSFAGPEGNLLKQAKEIGINTQFFGFYFAGDPEVIKIAGNASEGIIFTQFFDPNSNNILLKEYQNKFKEKFGRESEYYSALAYDGIFLLVKAMENCKDPEDTDCIKNELYKIKNFNGVTGPISFDSNGDTSKEIFLMTIKNGKLVKYEE